MSAQHRVVSVEPKAGLGRGANQGRSVTVATNPDHPGRVFLTVSNTRTGITAVLSDAEAELLVRELMSATYLNDDAAGRHD